MTDSNQIEITSRVVELTPEAMLGVLNEVEQKNAPERLYAVGDLALLRAAPRVSVVGSRKVSREGLARARSLSRALVDRGITVVSGLAMGVDTEAHRTAIEYSGKTIAVLGTPVDVCSPVANRSLQQEIMRDHLVVSQFASGTRVGRRNFPMRNRTMALFSDATVIVEASRNSGTVHQGWETLRLGRLLFLLESVARDETLTWPQEMISYGAQVLSRDNLELFLDEMPQGHSGDSITL